VPVETTYPERMIDILAAQHDYSARSSLWNDSRRAGSSGPCIFTTSIRSVLWKEGEGGVSHLRQAPGLPATPAEES
jgi:hypothetical protein